jgi:hypothetical protein
MSPHVSPEKNAPPLKREVARPPAHDRLFAQLLVLATLPMLAGMASLWIGAFIAPLPGSRVQHPGAASARPSAIAQRAMPLTPPAPQPTAPLEPGFTFAFELDGASYVLLKDMDALDDVLDLSEDAEALDDEDDVRPARAPLPGHAPPALVRMDGLPVAAVAAVQAEALSADLASFRAWQGREVLVDSACRARVTGFALVARVYAEDLLYEEQEQHLSAAALARAIFDDMGHLVLAARLDGCIGSYAQPAERPPAIQASELESHPAAAAAAAKLRQSKAGRAAQRTWRENDYERTWWRDAEVITQIVQHPRTRETFLSVHMLSDVECGGLEIHLWGLYRVDSRDQLEPLVQRQLDNIHELETFVDIDGDGRFELLASSLWGMDTFLLVADGSRKAMLHVPFFGCQC